MALTITELKRVFVYNKIELEDVPGATLREVAKYYSGTYPELINSTAKFDKIVDNIEYYSFDAQAGLKG